jgi:hypothetical protein
MSQPFLFVCVHILAVKLIFDRQGARHATHSGFDAFALPTFQHELCIRLLSFGSERRPACL